jgi:hypothetical protein
MLSRVMDGFNNRNNPLGVIYHKRTAVKGDAWRREPKQPLGTVKSSMNCCPVRQWRSTTQTAPRDSYIINEMLSRVMDVFDSSTNPLGVQNHKQLAVTDAWIRQPTQPLGTQKSSTNCYPVRQWRSTAQTALWDS